MSSEEKKVQPYEPFRFGWLERDSRPEGSPRNWWSGGTWTVPGDMIVETTVQEVEHAERCVNFCAGLNSEAVPGLVEACRKWYTAPDDDTCRALSNAIKEAGILSAATKGQP